MSTHPPQDTLPTKQEDGPSTVPGSDVNRDKPEEQKPDAKETRPRAQTTNRRRRKKDEGEGPDDKKNGSPEAKEKKEKKETKPRAPRRSRGQSTTAGSNNSRKKPKLEEGPENASNPPKSPNGLPMDPPAPGPAVPRSSQPPAHPGPALPPINHQPPPHYSIHQPPPHHHQSTFTAYSTIPSPSYYSVPQPVRTSRPPSQPAPAQRTSGQNYDPIRSAFGTSSPAPAPSTASASANHSSPQNAFRASASPAIASIIDPPHPAPQPAYPHHSPGHHSALSSPARQFAVPTSAAHSLAPSPMPVSSPSHGVAIGPQHLLSSGQPPLSVPAYHHYSPYERPPSYQQPPPVQWPQPQFSTQPPPPQAPPQRQEPPAQPQTRQEPPSQQQPPTAMDVDTDKPAPAPPAKASKKEKANAPSPQSRGTKDPPPLPQGSGLISTALFGKDDSNQSPDSSKPTPNIVLHVPLQGTSNRIINFARLAEEQYGFAALHPRAAAQRERLARVAAAGDALEKNGKGGKGIGAGESADEDSTLEVDRESEMDGDVAMGGTGQPAGVNGTAGAEEAGDGQQRRRKRKVEEYDRDDPFVDDSEMVWQESAAASKDGFFVFSGPLVQEGEKVQVERYVTSNCYISPTNTIQGRWNHQTWSRSRSRRSPEPWRRGFTASAHRCRPRLRDRPSSKRTGLSWRNQPSSDEETARPGQARQTGAIWPDGISCARRPGWSRQRARRCWQPRREAVSGISVSVNAGCSVGINTDRRRPSSPSSPASSVPHQTHSRPCSRPEPIGRTGHDDEAVMSTVSTGRYLSAFGLLVEAVDIHIQRSWVFCLHCYFSSGAAMILDGMV